MGSEGDLNRAGKLDIRLLGDTGWEEVAIYDADRLLWRRDEHQRLGPSPRHVRIRSAARASKTAIAVHGGVAHFASSVPRTGRHVPRFGSSRAAILARKRGTPSRFRR